MNIFSASLNVIIPIFVAIGLGIVFGRATKVNGRAISQAVVYLFAPALVLRELSRTEIHPEALGSIFAMALISSAGLLFAGWLISKAMKLPHPQESTLMLGVTLGNTGSIGLPLAQFAFGDIGLQYAAVFYVCTAIFANILGVYLPSRGKLSIKESITRIFQVPMIYAAVIGLALNLLGIALPTSVDRVFSLLGQGAVPSGLAFMGIQLANIKLQKEIKPILAGSVIRLFLAPLIGWLTALVLGVSGVLASVCILQISVPTALFTAMFSAEFGGDPEFASGVILLTTIGSFVTMGALISIMA